MADDKKKRGKPDRTRVSVSEPWEMAYWTKKFRVGKRQLRAAVKAAGVMVGDVERYFAGKKKAKAKKN